MRHKNKLAKKCQDHQRIVEVPEKHSKKIRYGAPDGPRPRHNDKYDGKSSLEYPGHEAVAHFLAEPKSIRQSKSVKDLARQFHVSRMTINRWGRAPDVIKRAHFLSEINQKLGDLLARQESPRIMQTAVQKAIKGDLQFIKFCLSRAFPNELQIEQSQLSATVSVQELFGTSESEDAEVLLGNDRKSEGSEQ